MLLRFVPSGSPSLLLNSLSDSDLSAIFCDINRFKQLSWFLTWVARLAMDVDILDIWELIVIDTALTEVGALRSDQSEDFFCFF